mmetsp:Transcript_82155/g.229010  ORF Transcript_82155/g.229010 Transcript_82155/m.229010 type:complete len:252 (-) Transcript_82155:220-975(-)
MSKSDFKKLADEAVRVEHKTRPRSHHLPQGQGTHTKVKQLHVPFEEIVKVPVKKHVLETGVRKEVVEGVEVVPVRKYRDVDFVVVDVEEKTIPRVRKVWKLVDEPFQKVVKEPIKRVITKRVPQTVFNEKVVEKTVEVPDDHVETHIGHRYDKVMKTKRIEVEHDEHFELHPVPIKKGEARMREVGDIEEIGKVHRGKPDWPEAQMKGSRSEHYVGERRNANDKGRKGSPSGRAGLGWDSGARDRSASRRR